MSDSLVGFLSDPSTLLALGAVAVGTAWYLSSSNPPTKPPIPLDNQSLEEVSSIARPNNIPSFLMLYLLQDSEHIHISHFAKDGLMRKYYDDVATLYEAFQRGKRVSSKCPPYLF